MPLDYNNPAIIRFLKENYEKEKEDRIRWFMRNKENIVACKKFCDGYKDYRMEEVARAYIEPLIPNLSAHYKANMKNHRKKYPPDYPVVPVSKAIDVISLSDEKLQEVHLNKIMKPVDPDVCNILKLEPPCGGRQKYLRKRYELIPEDKYYFCETSNNICGWGLRESKVGYSVSDYKRKNLFSRDLVSRSGPHPDPPHYKELQNYSKCNT